MAREVRVAILGDSRDFSRAVRDVQRDAGKLDSAFSGIKRAAIGLGGAFVAREAIQFGKSIVTAAQDSVKVTKQTEAVLKSMGTQSGLTAKKVAELSDRLSRQAGIDDELIQSSANVLLTFGKVRNEVGKGNQVFDRAAQATLDMSVALGTDLQSATIQVGKALNDPIAGLTSLTRAGVQFTDQQKEQIRTLVESGDTLGAQKIILDELEKQFSGSAEAQATATGKLSVAWDNVKETLGMKLLPVVESVAEWLAERLPGAIDTLMKWIEEDLVPALRSMRDWFGVHVLPMLAVFAGFIRETVIPAMAAIVSWIEDNDWVIEAFGVLIGVYMVGAFVAYVAAAGAAAAATIAAAAPFILFAGVVAGLTLATQYLINKFDLLPKASKVFQVFIDAAVWVGNAAAKVWDLVSALTRLSSVWNSIKDFSGVPAVPTELLEGRAIGGPVMAGSPYIVGERGPELFVPGQSGMIVPNNRLATSPSGAAVGATYNTITIHTGADPQSVVEAISRWTRTNGPAPFAVA